MRKNKYKNDTADIKLVIFGFSLLIIGLIADLSFDYYLDNYERIIFEYNEIK